MDLVRKRLEMHKKRAEEDRIKRARLEGKSVPSALEELNQKIEVSQQELETKKRIREERRIAAEKRQKKIEEEEKQLNNDFESDDDADAIAAAMGFGSFGGSKKK